MLRLSLAMAITAATSMAADPPGSITFHRDVLPILAKDCQGCHRPGQIAPMPFLTYETTRPWAQQIKVVVSSKKMPPAVSNPHFPVLTGRDGLTQAEIDILVKWVDSGAPEGTPPADERGSKKK
ncbi:MAG: hypothetical protein EXQ47_09275 [Bryobacterales bacterium]|nr:hypothetical protein [Bryobacterales bacterium]